MKLLLKIILLSVAIQVSEACKTSPLPPPQYLTVNSSGEAGMKQYGRMGIFELNGEFHNKKPVWSRHDGTEKIYYDYDNGGYWNIGPDPTNNKRGVSTKYKYKYTDLLPHQISEWEYLDDGEMYTDPKLTVTEGAPPEYPENINIKDKTGRNSDLAGVYRRQGKIWNGKLKFVWKYGDFELSHNGELWCITGDEGCITVAGWDYAEDYIWPYTDTLYIVEFPDIITIKSSGSACYNQASKMGDYELETNKTTFLRKVYKKKDRQTSDETLQLVF